MGFDKIISYLLKPLFEKEFTFKNYRLFLESISKDDRIKIVPLKELEETNFKNKIVLAIRHDIDSDIGSALTMARIEHDYGISTTYFVLHTASYYGTTKKNMASHNEKIVPLLKKIQNDFGHEIGFHNDLVTLEVIYDLDPVNFLKKELDWLRKNGIEIVGTAAHGAKECNRYKYHNFYFFKDFEEEIEGFPSRNFVEVKGRIKTISKAYLQDFSLKYEAYHLRHDQYLSDTRLLSKWKRWHPNYINWSEIQPGEKIIILIHPDHWAYSMGHKYLKLLRRFAEKLFSKI